MDCFNFARLVFVSGKGGVGKTTFACGLAQQWAYQFPQEHILLLSTDPAHSLADVLQMEVGSVSQFAPNLPNLSVRSLDAAVLLQNFRNQYGDVLQLLVERGSFVQENDLSPVWDLAWPGVDELMSLLEIQRLLREQKADDFCPTGGKRIVVDMAPSGHTLNLFALMDFLEQLLCSLELFQQKHRAIHQSFTGTYQPDQADRFLNEMKTDLATGRALLQDPQQTVCMVVAIAEPMSYLETERFLQALAHLHIPVGGVVVNRVRSSNGLSSGAASTASEFEQQKLLAQFLQLAAPHPLFTLPLQQTEPIGSIALAHLFTQLQHCPSTPPPTSVPTHFAIPAKVSPGFPDFIAENRRLILVGGKGGVGKTTVAAAIGVGMAERYPARQIQVISIDPAHSLGDAFGVKLAHQPTSLMTNLSGQEVDATHILNQFRAEYLWELAEMMSGNPEDETVRLAYAPEAWRQIVSQALPGIDEMLSLLMVMERLDQGQDLIILDMAPTGHLLRFLEMPMALADWLAWIFKLWIKYQDMVGHTALMGRLRALRQRVMWAQKNLQNPSYTEFIGVFQAESAIVAEAERLVSAITERNISQRYLLHNRYTPEQAVAVQRLSERFADQTLVQLPELPRAIEPLAFIRLAAQLLF
jgi:arsenite-transporting ATPase